MNTHTYAHSSQKQKHMHKIEWVDFKNTYLRKKTSPSIVLHWYRGTLRTRRSNTTAKYFTRDMFVFCNYMNPKGKNSENLESNFSHIKHLRKLKQLWEKNPQSQNVWPNVCSLWESSLEYVGSISPPSPPHTFCQCWHVEILYSWWVISAFNSAEFWLVRVLGWHIKHIQLHIQF